MERLTSLKYLMMMMMMIGNLIRAFQIYVYPQLVECSTQIWSPSNVGLINLIGSIQHSFTKYISGFQNLSYTERLAKIKLPSLEHCHLIHDIVSKLFMEAHRPI